MASRKACYHTLTDQLRTQRQYQELLRERAHAVLQQVYARLGDAGYDAWVDNVVNDSDPWPVIQGKAELALAALEAIE